MIQLLNGRLSAWNTKAVLVNKLKNPKSLNEPRLTFNYIHIKKNIPNIYFKLAAKVHNYLFDAKYNCYFQADVKHAYFTVPFYANNRYIFAFIISKLP